MHTELIIFGVFFLFIALMGVITFFGGVFNTQKIRAVAGDKVVKYHATVNGQRFSDARDAHEAINRDRRRQARSGNRKKQRYNESKVTSVGFSYEAGDHVCHTDPKMTRCLVSQFWIAEGCEYTIRMSNRHHSKVRVGLFEVLKIQLIWSKGVISKMISFVGVIINALISLTVVVGSSALGIWFIRQGIQIQ
ncbi:MAG: hypothetical protein K5927_06150 [Lachnospiraceae bacterium]|nr:hypothetical protein [Lachnospiraceae bacterium]